MKSIEKEYALDYLINGRFRKYLYAVSYTHLNAIDTINFWKEQGLSGVEIAGIIGNIGGAENTTFTLDLLEEGGDSGGLYLSLIHI